MARRLHVAWTPTSLPDSIVLLGGWDNAAPLTAEILPGFEKWSSSHLFFVIKGGKTFALRHRGHGQAACGIPDGDTIVMTGGWRQHYVTRWLSSPSPSSLCKNLSIKTVFPWTNRLDCNGFYFMTSPSSPLWKHRHH